MNFKAILFSDDAVPEDYDVDIDDFPEGEDTEEPGEDDDNREDEVPEELEVDKNGHIVRNKRHHRKDEDDAVLDWDER